MSFLTLEEAANLLGCKPANLQLHVKKIPYFFKEKILQEVKSTKGNTVKSMRKRWLIKKEDISLLKEYWAALHRPKSRRNINPNDRLCWTRTAIECYRAKLSCPKCPNYEVCKEIAHYTNLTPYNGLFPQKYTVLKLFAKVGKPPIERIIEE